MRPEVCVYELDAGSEFAGVAAGDSESRGGNIGGPYLGRTIFQGDGHRNCSRSSAYVDNASSRINTSSAAVTRCSVSGRGMSTSDETVKSRP